MRRRNFAASMVVTVSLAELACTSSVSTGNPPQPEPTASGVEPAQRPVDPPEGPPTASGPVAPDPIEDSAGGDPSPPETPAKPTRDIKVQLDGTCMEFFSTDCPEGDKCNPPPPREVNCPEDVLPKATNVKTVTRRNNGWCFEPIQIDPDACPKGAMCNPPPPRRVQCPDNVFPKAKNAQNVSKRSDGSCWEFIDVKCEPDATCNPPPPRRVQCETGDDPNDAPKPTAKPAL